ncbi:MAG: filamentous hemagglutinin N-terminal domain-containing protein [Parachlamydiales bacterium]
MLYKVGRFAISILTLASIVPAMRELNALPVLDHVANGNANPVVNGDELRIEASDNAILNFRNFDIQRHETVRFEMADASHRVLNRVNSDVPSLIHGKLFSNGIVYLMNPAGIVFGPDCVVNVSALYAAAAHLSDTDFLQGIDRFLDVHGNIEVFGSLVAQDIALIGKTILQKGTVLAEEGHLLYATAENVYLGKENGHLFVKCERELLQEPAQASCFFECGTPEAFLLHHAGVSKAKKIHLYAENESLVEVKGDLAATESDLSGKGGDIAIQGDVIRFDGANVSATGKNGGGEILIGGGDHGRGLHPTAKYLECDIDTEIHANASELGDGGKIVLWADRGLIFDGKLLVDGGPLGGNGGYIETSSGHHFVATHGKVSVLAPQGQLGKWVLDPLSIQIGITPYQVVTLAQLADTTNNSVYLVDPAFLAGQTGPLNIMLEAVQGTGSAQNIQVGNNTTSPINLINPNANVAVQFDTVSVNDSSVGSFLINGTVEFDGNLTFNANTTLLGDATITSRNGAITFNGFVTSSPPGSFSLTLSAKNDINFNGQVGAGAFSNFNVGSAANINFAQSATVGGPASTVNLTNNFTANNSFFVGGNLTVNSTAGNMVFNNLVQCQPNISFPSNLLILNANTVPGQTISFTAPAQTVTFSGGAHATSNISFAGPVVISTPNPVSTTSFSSTNGTITFANTFQNASAPSAANPVTLSSGGAMTFTGNVGTAPFQSFTISSAASAAFGAQATLSGSIHTTGDTTFAGTVFPVGNLSITSDTGNIAFNNTTSSLTGAYGLTPQLNLSAAQDITFLGSVGIIPIGDVQITTARNVHFFLQNNPTVAVQTFVANSFTQLAGTGNTLFEGPLITFGAPVAQAAGTVPTAPKNGGPVSITTNGAIKFYWGVQNPPSPGPPPPFNPVIPVEMPASNQQIVFKSVITTTGGRQSSSTSIPTNTNAPNGLSGGDVTLSGSSINLLGIYAGGTPAFPGTAGTGGKGGTVSITSTSGTSVQGPIIATGGPGANGGAQDYPVMTYSGQNLNAAGADSPGDITINGPATLQMNGIVMRGGNINIGNIQSSAPGNLLAIDASSASAVNLGGLSNLSYFIVDYAKGLTVTGASTISGVDLVNAGTNHITFKQNVTSTDIQAFENNFCAVFEQGFNATTSSFLNCGVGCPPNPPPPPPPPPGPPPPPPPPGPPPPPPPPPGPTPEPSPSPFPNPHGKGFAGVYYPTFNFLYYPGYLFGNDDSFLAVPREMFYLSFISDDLEEEKLQ